MATSKLCDSCKSAAPNLYCRADSAFLCVSCDARVHAANKLASRHARVWMCEVCEQAPAHVTCKADAAALCVTCDRDIHSANPLARRHERVPVVPFYDPVPSADGFVEEDEVEAASWLLPAAAKPDPYACSFPDIVDPFLDLDYVDAKQEEVEEEEDPSGDNNSSGTADGVVPVQSQLNPHQLFTNHGSSFELDFSSPLGASKPLTFPTYNFHSTPCLSHSVSSSSMEVGVVPEGEIYSSGGQQVGVEQGKEAVAVALSGVDREARVLRYREKRKNRKFEKTIRYASRKAYAETRPRIKGRFAKRTDLDHNHDHDHDHDHLVDHRSSHLLGFGVVPSY